MKAVLTLSEPEVADCRVFCLVTYRDSEKSFYCGSDEYVSRFEANEPIHMFDSAMCSKEDGTRPKRKLTDTGNFNLPDLDGIEGQVEASPEKTRRVHQKEMLMNMPISQGTSSTLNKVDEVSAFTNPKKK